MNLREAEIQIAELQVALGNAHLRASALENDVLYYKGIARQNEEILRETGLSVWFDGDAATVGDKINEVKARYEKGGHMELFEGIIRTDPMVADAWNRFMMSLRLGGYDGTRSQDE